MRLSTEPARDFLRPIHRQVASRLGLTARRHYLYFCAMGRPGHFAHPETFNEKINWRILNDRRPQLVDACDKLRMKDVAREQLGPEVLRIPETLWSGTDIEQIDDAVLAGEVVVKPNHGSGDVIFGPTSKAELRERTQDWLQPKQADHLGEWAYSQARRLIVVEERIPGPSPLIDYKILSFDGEPRIVQVHSGRFGPAHKRTFYDTSWNKLPVRTTHQENDDVPRPDNLEQMLDIARTLARGWEFIRLDLYSVNGEAWLGEYSPYPCGGVAHFRPESFDRYLGTLWTLPDLATVTV